MSLPKEHFDEDTSIMIKLFTPSEFVTIGGHNKMREVKEKFISELEGQGYDLSNFQLRYMPRYRDILIYSKIYKNERNLERELLDFFQGFKDRYLLDYGSGNVEPVQRVMPVPIEQQPPLG